MYEFIFANNKFYDVFWSNKEELDYAEVIYESKAKVSEPIKLDAKNNKIVYSEAPSGDYSVEYYFVDLNGKRYE